MLRGVFLLLLCQLCGEVLARGLNLPAPGPVIGLGLLAAGLALWARRQPAVDVDATDVGKASNALLASLSLMFVPAGVGVVQYVGLLREYGLALALSLIVSTVLTLLATVGVFLLVNEPHRELAALGLSADDAAVLANGDAGRLPRRRRAFPPRAP